MESKRNTINAMSTITKVVGVLFGLSGINHGFFEVLQGNKPTGGILIQAIGEAQRFWALGTEEAFTIIPNFLVTGITAMLLGMAIVIWTIWFLDTRRGPFVFLGLFILLFLCGGGIGQVVFFIPAWAFASRMRKPLDGWKKFLPRSIRPVLANLWPVTLIVASLIMLFGVEAAIFGIIPGVQEPENIQNTAMLLIFLSAVLFVVTYIAGLAHELKGKEQPI
jgi:hypothetical protein